MFKYTRYMYSSLFQVVFTVTLLKFSSPKGLIFCETFHLARKKCSFYVKRILQNVDIYPKAVRDSVSFITLLHQYKISVISLLRRHLGQSDSI
jgi:hypothetical protein